MCRLPRNSIELSPHKSFIVDKELVDELGRLYDIHRVGVIITIMLRDWIEAKRKEKGEHTWSI